MPAAAWVLGITIAAYLLVSVAVGAALPPLPGPWIAHLVLEVLFTVVWYRLLLRVFRKPERFLQTTSAVFGYQTIIAPLMIASASLLVYFRNNAAALFPILLVALGILVWQLAANVRILRAALERPLGACIALVLLETFASQLLLLLVFPPPPPVGATS